MSRFSTTPKIPFKTQNRVKGPLSSSVSAKRLLKAVLDNGFQIVMIPAPERLRKSTADRVRDAWNALAPFYPKTEGKVPKLTRSGMGVYVTKKKPETDEKTNEDAPCPSSPLRRPPNATYRRPAPVRPAWATFGNPDVDINLTRNTRKNEKKGMFYLPVSGMASHADLNVAAKCAGVIGLSENSPKAAFQQQARPTKPAPAEKKPAQGKKTPAQGKKPARSPVVA